MIDYAHTLDWVTFTYSESGPDLDFTAAAELQTFFSLNLNMLYDYTNPTWCSTPATFNNVTPATFDVTSVCGVDFNAVSISFTAVLK